MSANDLQKPGQKMILDLDETVRRFLLVEENEFM